MTATKNLKKTAIKNINMKGTVKWYDDIKNFGFIHSEEGSDIFVHISGLKDSYKSL